MTAEEVADAADGTADAYNRMHAAASGLDQIIYGEIRDAFTIFAQRIRTTEPEKTG